ncbi:transcriptional regulator [Streptomyces sulfonofaciens]|uniref:Transcriptional regulator n=1 Tax=Streptomyces sulfonofaciens TaxID=68272 RepID=A0A919FNB7_9ACTN|nr:GntR family transcriptional regulator [Streptomyces sulfonofaciens]GHH69263.1 transcriptional regulator [Streptomyces sulfonofaciens]
MAYDHKDPKYIRLARTIQRRIEDGVYAPGALLPSEHALAGATGMSRPTVVRALSLLKQDGWIESRQGYGTVARGRPESVGQRVQCGRIAAERVESQADGHLVAVGFVRAPHRIAALLDVPDRTVVLLRRFLTERDAAPSEVVSAYFTKEMAADTLLADPAPLDESLLGHVETRRRTHYDHIRERVTARPACDEEADLLGLEPRAWLLAVLASAYDTFGNVLHVTESLLPPAGGALEDVYRVG